MKVYKNLFGSWIDKKRHSINEWHFPKPKSLGVNVDLSNYATKADLKNATGVDTSFFAKRTYLAKIKSDVDKLDIQKFKNVLTNLNNLKNKVDKLDVDKLVPALIDLSELNDVVKNDVVNTYSLAMALDSICVQNFHYLTIAWVKDISILGKGPTQGLNNANLTAETQYSVDFSRSKIKFRLSLHYYASNSFLFVNATKYINSKQKIMKLRKYSLRLEKPFQPITWKNRIKWVDVRVFCWL